MKNVVCALSLSCTCKIEKCQALNHIIIYLLTRFKNIKTVC